MCNAVFAQPHTKKRGKVTTYYANRVKASAGRVMDFKKQGSWRYWNDSGQLEKIICYSNDLKNGTYAEFYIGGDTCVFGTYFNDKKSGIWNAWYKNGKRQYIEYYENGLKQGTWRTYPELSEAGDSLPSTIVNYENGKRQGLRFVYKQGKIREEVNYVGDRVEGSCKKWDSNGLLAVSENYLDGKLDGLCKYYAYEKCIKEVTYVVGRINGTSVEYDLLGHKFRISWYNQDIIDSTFNFHTNGALAMARYYKYYPGFANTEEFSDYSEWDSQGHLLLKGTYHFESRDKEWLTFYPDKKIKSTSNYSGGKLGLYRKWYPNGKLMIEIVCNQNGAVVKPPMVWDLKGKLIEIGSKTYLEIVESSQPGETYNPPPKNIENRTNRTSD